MEMSWSFAGRARARQVVISCSLRKRPPPAPIDSNAAAVFWRRKFKKHSIVAVSNLGAGLQAKGPWTDVLFGDPEKGGMPASIFVQAVDCPCFQGEKSGWVIEGRDAKIGPANILGAVGTGQTATVGLVRGFAVPTQKTRDVSRFTFASTTITGRMRSIRTSRGSNTIWASFRWNAKRPSGSKTSTFNRAVLCGDYRSSGRARQESDSLEDFSGSQLHLPRPTPVDMGYPDYQLTDAAKRWVAPRQGPLGFRVGIWVNTYGIDESRTDLLKRFKPGFKVGRRRPPNGKRSVLGASKGRFVYCSARV